LNNFSIGCARFLRQVNRTKKKNSIIIKTTLRRARLTIITTIIILLHINRDEDDDDDDDNEDDNDGHSGHGWTTLARDRWVRDDCGGRLSKTRRTRAHGLGVVRRTLRHAPHETLQAVGVAQISDHKRV